MGFWEWLEEVSASSSVKAEELLMSLCIAQQPNPTCALHHEAFSSKTCFANRSSPDKKRMQGWSCCTGFKDSETLPSAGVSHPLPLQHNSYPEKWISSALSDFSKAGIWLMVYGGLELERNRISFPCYVPDFLCGPALAGDFHLPLKSQVQEGFDRDDLVCKWLHSWPANSSCFSFVQHLWWNQWEHFSKVSTSYPGGKYLQRVPFAGAARLNTAQEIRKQLNFGTASTDTTSNWSIVPLRSSNGNLGRWWECWCVNHQSTHPPRLLASSVDNFCSGYRSLHHVQHGVAYPGRKKIMNSTQKNKKLNCLDNLRLFLLRKSIWLEAGKLPTLPAEWGCRDTEKPIWITKTVSFPFFFFVLLMSPFKNDSL